MLNCIIVDDEQFSVDAISKYIGVLPRLNIAGVYTNPEMALEKITDDNNVDILFMDIDMPVISGLELAKVLRSKTQKLIFTTSHSKYAFEAFEMEGDAYLLKPFSFSKFLLTINRLFPVETNKGVDANTEKDHFLVKSKEDDLRILKVAYKDVIAFESSKNYVQIHLTNYKSIIAYLTIKDVFELLQGRAEFKQFHRAFIISVDYISYIEGNTIKMNNNLNFSIGDNYRDIFSEYVSEKLLKTFRKK